MTNNNLIFKGVALFSVFISMLLVNISIFFYNDYLIQFLSIATIISVIGTVAIFYYSRKKLRTLPLQKEFDFVTIGKDIIYFYQDMQNIYYIKKLKLRALRDGIRVYANRYNWSGSGDVEISCKGHKVIKTEKFGNWQCYSVYFKKTLYRDDIADIEFIFHCHDPEGKAKPYIYTVIDNPTKDLAINLTLPKKFDVKEVMCDIKSSNTSEAEESINKPFQIMEDFCVADWKIKKPELFYNYAMRWEISTNGHPNTD